MTDPIHLPFPLPATLQLVPRTTGVQPFNVALTSAPKWLSHYLTRSHTPVALYRSMGGRLELRPARDEHGISCWQLVVDHQVLATDPSLTGLVDRMVASEVGL